MNILICQSDNNSNISVALEAPADRQRKHLTVQLRCKKSEMVVEKLLSQTCKTFATLLMTTVYLAVSLSLVFGCTYVIQNFKTNDSEKLYYGTQVCADYFTAKLFLNIQKVLIKL